MFTFLQRRITFNPTLEIIEDCKFIGSLFINPSFIGMWFYNVNRSVSWSFVTMSEEFLIKNLIYYLKIIIKRFLKPFN